MNNENPFYLFTHNKSEFLDKRCSICLTTLFYPETGTKFVSCSRLNCNHMFHHSCINQSIVSHHLSCPECRTQISNITNIDKSLEIAIRSEAFDNGYIDANIQETFNNNSIVKLKDYSYHKLDFELWNNIINK